MKFPGSATPALLAISRFGVGRAHIAAWDSGSGNYKPWNQLMTQLEPRAGATVTLAADNSYDFGTASFRGRIGFFAQGVQTTSDARHKSDVRQMTAAELRAGAAIAKSIGVFRWLSDDSDRLHVGATVQTIIACMEAEGLNAFEYGFVCHDEWGDQYQDVFEDVTSETGEVEQVATGQKILVREAGDIYSLRDHELYKFLIRAQEERLDDLEKRLSELEAK
jgi:hypothetical protein